jgi:hypothetical protein
VIDHISGGQFMKRMSHGLMLMVAVFLLHVPLAFAQVDRATLTGVVKDSSGGVVPGATVTVTNLATNLETHQQTTETGSYQGGQPESRPLSDRRRAERVQEILAGHHARGRPARAPRLSSCRSGSWLKPIIVAESTQLINTNDATLGAVIPQMQVANLPLAIRNWDDLLALVPGVQGDRYTEQGGGTSFGRTGGINVHGARALQNNFLLDGVDNNSISENVQELTTQVSRPSVDAIQEFKVVTSPYSAEYGRSPGAAVSVSTKSGTNDFHGTGYEYFRNDSFDSNDFFSKRAGRGQAGQRSESVRRQHRRTGRQEPRILLHRLRGDAHQSRRHPADARADGRRAQRDLHQRRAGSTQRRELRQQSDSAGPDRSVCGRDHGPRADAEPAGSEQLLPNRGPGRRLGPLARPVRLEADRQ